MWGGWGSEVNIVKSVTLKCSIGRLSVTYFPRFLDCPRHQWMASFSFSGVRSGNKVSVK